MKKTQIALVAMLMLAVMACILVTSGPKDAPVAALSEKRNPPKQKAKPQGLKEVIVTAELNVAFKD